MLVGLALIGLADLVLAQAQRHRSGQFNRVGHGLDAGGGHGRHLLDQGEKAVDLRQCAVGLLGRKLEAELNKLNAGSVMYADCDVTDSKSMDAFFAAVIKKFGR